MKQKNTSMQSSNSKSVLPLALEAFFCVENLPRDEERKIQDLLAGNMRLSVFWNLIESRDLTKVSLIKIQNYENKNKVQSGTEYTCAFNRARSNYCSSSNSRRHSKTKAVPTKNNAIVFSTRPHFKSDSTQQLTQPNQQLTSVSCALF